MQPHKTAAIRAVDPAGDRPSRSEAEAAVATLLRWTGEDPAREGLRDTPARVVRAYEDIFSGYGKDPQAILSRVFSETGGYDAPVVVRDLDFASHCEHHLMPFVGRAHVAYWPQGGVVGLSKIGRLVDAFARRMQTQERLTAQIAEAMDVALHPLGVAVMLEAEHFCMTLRGIAKPGTMTLTTAFRGVFATDPAARASVLSTMRDAR